MEGLGAAQGLRGSCWIAEGLRLQITSMEPWNEMTDIRFAWKIAPGVRKEAFDEGIML